jgi:hypothetical protein
VYVTGDDVAKRIEGFEEMFTRESMTPEETQRKEKERQVTEEAEARGTRKKATDELFVKLSKTADTVRNALGKTVLVDNNAFRFFVDAGEKRIVELKRDNEDKLAFTCDGQKVADLVYASLPDSRTGAKDWAWRGNVNRVRVADMAAPSLEDPVKFVEQELVQWRRRHDLVKKLA